MSWDFRYAGEELDLDGLDTYELELADPERSVPNAQRTKLDKAIAGWRKQAKALEAQLGRAIDTDEEVPPPNTQYFKMTHSALRAELALIREKLAQLKGLPKRIAVRETVGENEQALALTVEHKHFMNILKMAVYRAETALYRMLVPTTDARRSGVTPHARRRTKRAYRHGEPAPRAPNERCRGDLRDNDRHGQGARGAPRRGLSLAFPNSSLVRGARWGIG